MPTETFPFIATILLPSCRAAVLILGLFLLRSCFGNRISPALRHAFWGLVPLALLPLAISSPISVYNLLPQNYLAGTPLSEPQSESYGSDSESQRPHLNLSRQLFNNGIGIYFAEFAVFSAA